MASSSSGPIATEVTTALNDANTTTSALVKTTPGEFRILIFLAFFFASISVLSSALTFYWFIKMRRSFRHDLIMLLIQSDMFKALWFMSYPLVFLIYGPVRNESVFCQISGFFLTVGIEQSDVAVLIIAVHSALHIFKNKPFGKEEGLYPYRHTAYTIWCLFPPGIASLAFIGGPHAYVASQTHCYLRSRPLWYKLALDWIPRYIIFIIILGTYCSIYYYVCNKFHSFTKYDKEIPRSNLSYPRTNPTTIAPLSSHDLTHESSATSKNETETSSIAKTFTRRGSMSDAAHFMMRASFARMSEPNTPTFRSPNIPTIRSPNISTFRSPSITAIRSPSITAIRSPNLTAIRSPNLTAIRSPNLPTIRSPIRPPLLRSPVGSYSVRGSFSLHSVPNNIQSGFLSPHDAFAISKTSTELAEATSPWFEMFVNRYSSTPTSNSITPDSNIEAVNTNSMISAISRVPTTASIAQIQDSLSQIADRAQMMARRDQIQRQLRFLFIYPLIYIGIWIMPFVSNIVQFDDRYASNPPFLLSCITTVSIGIQAFVDCWLFASREKPWRHIPGNNGSFWASLKFWTDWSVLAEMSTYNSGPGRTRDEMVREARAAYQRRDDELAFRRSQLDSSGGRLTQPNIQRSWWDIERAGDLDAMSLVEEEKSNNFLRRSDSVAQSTANISQVDDTKTST